MDSANMVEIPAGRFRMGCADFYPEERPVREVQVEAFAIGPAQSRSRSSRDSPRAPAT